MIKVFCLAKTHKLGWLAIHTYSGTEGCFTLFAACLLGLVPVRPVKMAMELMKISNQYKQQFIFTLYSVSTNSHREQHALADVALA